MGYICCRICKYKINVYSHTTIFRNFKTKKKIGMKVLTILKTFVGKSMFVHGTTLTLSKTVQSK